MLWLSVVEWSSRLILLLLIFLSLWSVKIMIDRRRFFKEFIFPVDELRQKIKNKNFNCKFIIINKIFIIILYHELQISRIQ